jgi:alkanesulfonate monooxygenase SsuD/methylene tetrahydromethanopterin reductase-like flavin-dependent oxidoreductase (luciferase family)
LYDIPGVGARGPWEAWTSLAALAAVTTRVELGPLVASIGFHSPTMLAKQAATVDAISGGRLIVGLGAGWNEREYAAYGFCFDRRVSRFAEAFTVIRSLLHEGHCDFHGTFYDIDHCDLHPGPARAGGPPLWIGSVRPRMLSIGLPYVDAWNVWWTDYGNSPAGFAELKARIDLACQAVGRDPASVAATAAVFVQLPGGGGRQAGSYPHDQPDPVRGTPADIADHLRGMAEAGATHLQLVVDPITRASLEALAEVLDIYDHPAS